MLNFLWLFFPFAFFLFESLCHLCLCPYGSLSSGFSELLADLVEAAVAHCQLIVVSK